MSSTNYQMEIERYINATGEERIKTWLDTGDGGALTRMINPTPFQLPFLKDIKYHSSSATPLPRASFLYTVQQPACNGLNNLGGGSAAILLDFLSVMPTCHSTDPNWIRPGVSRTLTLTFLRPVKLGETVRIETEVLAIGKTLATVRAVIRSEKDGSVMVTAEHGIVRLPDLPKL